MRSLNALVSKMYVISESVLEHTVPRTGSRPSAMALSNSLTVSGLTCGGFTAARSIASREPGISTVERRRSTAICSTLLFCADAKSRNDAARSSGISMVKYSLSCNSVCEVPTDLRKAGHAGCTFIRTPSMSLHDNTLQPVCTRPRTSLHPPTNGFCLNPIHRQVN
jgi:hypothetical protein